MENKIEHIINFSGAYEKDGSLVYLEGIRDIPFEVKRVFYIFDVPNGVSRADHASLNSDFVLIAINGSVTVTLDDCRAKNQYDLRKRDKGLFVPNMTWMITSDFSHDAVLLVLANTSYDECRYIQNYDEFCGKRGAR